MNTHRGQTLVGGIPLVCRQYSSLQSCSDFIVIGHINCMKEMIEEDKTAPETIFGRLGRTIMLQKTIFGKKDVLSHAESKDDVQIGSISVQYSGLGNGVTDRLNSPLLEVGEVKGLFVDPTDFRADRGNLKLPLKYFVQDSIFIVSPAFAAIY